MAFVDSDDEFKTRVTDSLARLETSMKSLVGNGQPGQIEILRRRVALHAKLIWIASGAVIIGWAFIKSFLHTIVWGAYGG